jgi:class 3 adenylate cyclase
MSRSLDRPILVSASFAAACGEQRERLVSIGRYALRGVGRPQELFTLDLAERAPARRPRKARLARAAIEPDRRDPASSPGGPRR